MKRSARIALRRLGSMSQKRPAAGGESCEQDSFYDRNGICSDLQALGSFKCWADMIKSHL